MRSLFSFLVNPLNEKRYDDTIKIGGIDFIKSSSKEDHMISNRFAKVLETPVGYNGDIKKGDLLLVHHNVFKFYNDMKGRERSGKSYIQDNVFTIDEDQYFMYKGKDGWVCDGRCSFVKPVKASDKDIHRNIEYEPLQGEMKYLSKEAVRMGLKAGDIVMFHPDSEYEFNVDGEKLYRIYDNHLAIKLN